MLVFSARVAETLCAHGCVHVCAHAHALQCTNTQPYKRARAHTHKHATHVTAGTLSSFESFRCVVVWILQAISDDPVPVWEGIRTSFSDNDKRINLPAGGFVDGLEWERWAGLEAAQGCSGTSELISVDDGRPGQDNTIWEEAGRDLSQRDDEVEAPPGAGLIGLANEYAVGHMLNHPGRGQAPNVMDWSLKLELDDLIAAGVPRHRVPYAVHPVWCVRMHLFRENRVECTPRSVFALCLNYCTIT